METMPTWVTAVVAIGGLLGGGLGAWLLSVYNARNNAVLSEEKHKDDAAMAKDKQIVELRISENEQAFKIYKDLLDNIRTDFGKMTADMAKLEDERLKYREENASLKAEIRALTKEIDALKVQIGIKTPPSMSIIDDHTTK